MTIPLAQRTPPEIDAEIQTHQLVLGRAEQELARAQHELYRPAGAVQRYEHGRQTWTLTYTEVLTEIHRLAAAGESEPSWRTTMASELLGRLATARAAIVEINEKIEPLHQEWLRRHWSRFFVVQNAGGHIHSSTACSTCRPTTRFGWPTELSGQSEAEAVAAYGAIMCTVCFPSAPVEWTNKYEVERAAKEAALCPGSRTFNYPRETARTGYFSGNYGTCSVCGERVTLTSGRKLKAHKPPTASNRPKKG